MIDAEIRTHLEGVEMRNAMNVAEAIELALSALINRGGDENMRAAVTLMEIHDSAVVLGWTVAG